MGPIRLWEMDLLYRRGMFLQQAICLKKLIVAKTY